MSSELPVLTGTDNDGSSAVRSDEHSLLGVTGYVVSTREGLPGTVIQRHLTRTTEKKSSPGPSWPFMCQQKGSSERFLLGFRPCQLSSVFKLIQLLCWKLFRKSSLWSPLWMKCGSRNLQQRGSNKQLGCSHFLKHNIYSQNGPSAYRWHHLHSVTRYTGVAQLTPAHLKWFSYCHVVTLCSIKSASEPNSSQRENGMAQF